MRRPAVISAVLALVVVALAPTAAAEGISTGPVVEKFGPVVEMGDDAFNLVPGTQYRLLFDVAAGNKTTHALNRRLESAARFLNMHARAGIDPDDLEIEIVTHGGSTWDMLSDEAYRERFDRDNPNTALLKALSGAGVSIRLCGQSAFYNGIDDSELAPQVSMAVSAMTVMVRRQSEGWVLLP